MAEKKSSLEKLAERSDYERGKLDGMAETVALLNERGSELLKRTLAQYQNPEGPKYNPAIKGFYDLPEDERVVIDGYYKSAKAIWVIYRRRAV